MREREGVERERGRRDRIRKREFGVGWRGGENDPYKSGLIKCYL